MPTRRQSTGATAARNVHPRLRLSAAPLRRSPDAPLRRTDGAGRSLDLRTVYQQFVRRLWVAAS